MKNQFIHRLFPIVLLFLQACVTPKYFHDPSSFEIQKQIRSSRTSNVFVDIGSVISTTIIGVALETGIVFPLTDQQFKKINLLNTTSDTMYVNMLTDVNWDENNYCDFMDIRIPPKRNCKVSVPINANYNIYYRTTPECDDEMLEINTNSAKRIKLAPGLVSIPKKEKEKN
ncbi:hypothetical protein [Maribellus sp. YY47]|uniref:hypothetical protein n=1 Tax=Maribellus sp. YY47 TaxID=2929486 RepID=UPI0020007A4E|nr:hypothetical protein [Maribellus sp. YY47]MCK3685422.1 hypothetical protein [Maribellus sp. YY47]